MMVIRFRKCAYQVQPVKHADSGLPVNASVGDRDTVLEARRTLGGDVLPARVDVRLDHHTRDGTIASLELLADVVGHLGLVIVILLRVTV